MTRIATTNLSAELVAVSVRQLQLLAHIIDPSFEVYFETPGLVVAASTQESDLGPSFDRYYVRTAHALLELDMIKMQSREDTIYLVAADDVAAALS